MANPYLVDMLKKGNVLKKGSRSVDSSDRGRMSAQKEVEPKNSKPTLESVRPNVRSRMFAPVTKKADEVNKARFEAQKSAPSSGSPTPAKPSAPPRKVPAATPQARPAVAARKAPTASQRASKPVSRPVASTQKKPAGKNCRMVRVCS